MKRVPLKVQVRTKTGKQYARKLRHDGNIPAVIYGKKSSPIPIEMDGREFERLMSLGGRNVLIDLAINDGKAERSELAMIKEFQRDAFQKQLLHVDFNKISLDEKVTTTVAIHLVGEAPGVKEGGVLESLIWEVEIEALPLMIPEILELDITGMKMDSSLHVRDLKVPEGVEITEDPDETVIIIHAPRAVLEAEAAPAEAEETAEAAAAPAEKE